MKLLKSFRTAMVTGLLIVLPAWLAVLLFLKVLVKLAVIVKPITGQMPEVIDHPSLVALVTFILICIVVGLLFQTTLGRSVGKMIEDAVLSRIPGYAALRSIAAQVGEFDSDHDFRPALIDVEDGCLAPAFLIEEHENGFSTVFMPSVPTPMAGAIFIMPSERVKPVDVSVAAMMKCISKWGSGSSEILRALPPESLPKPS